MLCSRFLKRPGSRSRHGWLQRFGAATERAFEAMLQFYDRTLRTQITRESPFSLWDWAQYHARGIPDLHIVQRVLQVLLVVGAVAVAFVPRTKTPLQLAALTGALLIGFEVVLTHWFYLYIPWFFPFVVFALLWNEAEQPEARL